MQARQPFGLLSCIVMLAALHCTIAPAQTNRIDDIPLNALSLSGLKEFAASVSPRFETECERQPIDGMPRRVVWFTVDGLRQYALVIEPAGEPPADGWTVLIANHGHHPNPPDYGKRTADGMTDRPGDYYRDVPSAFARRGFLVVMPDFRGHNDSQGADYTKGMLEAYWYSRDSVAAFRALPSLPRADASRVYMWGHSMGGEVTLRAALALGDKLSGATIWSSTTGDPWQRAMHHALATEGADIDNSNSQQKIVALENWVDELPFEFEPWQGDPTRFVHELEVPLAIHHSIREIYVPYSRSVALVSKLDRHDKDYQFHGYDGDEHMFRGDRFEQAIDRDVEFFRTLLAARKARSKSLD